MVYSAMKIMRAAEDYLEAMLMMKEKHGYIRSIDVADYLGVTKPSACARAGILQWIRTGSSP